MSNQVRFVKQTPPHKVFFSWEINVECNYACSYCNPRDTKATFLIVDELVEIWDWIYDGYGSCQINISGGEPFMYPNFIELITKLSKRHTLEITTNLSMDIRPLFENITPDKACLCASLHPEFVELNGFIDKLSLLKEKGYHVGVNYVGYPPHLAAMSEYKKAIEEKGIGFHMLPFSGKYKGRDYPLGYTVQEKKLMNFSDSVDIETIGFRTDKQKSSTKGKLCRMGQMYAKIFSDGEAFRCCSIGIGALRLGNLLDKTFKFLKEPMPCGSDICPCFKCMLVGEEEYWAEYWFTPDRANYIA